MTATPAPQGDPSPSRREFLKRSTVAVVGSALAGSLSIARSAHAGGSDEIKVGLVGCGGRGTGAAAQALAADPGARLVAMGDVFADRLHSSLANLRRLDETPPGEQPRTPQVLVDDDHQFVGFDAYQRVIDSDVDVVLLATPPHFRPAHIRAAVDAGKHLFCEKPVAVDGPGARSVLESAALAEQKGLSIVSGFCWRYHPGVRETIGRVRDGAIGEIVTIHEVYNTGSLWMHPRQPDWSDMEWQLRNWLYFTWLSGDHIVEQHVHSLDKAAWVMGEVPPARATGTGGRQVRVEPEYGHIYDHFAICYEYESGVKLFSYCRQQDGCANDVSDYILGTKGRANVLRHRIQGETNWRYDGPDGNMYQIEHNELFASIRSGQPINDGVSMTQSSLLAVMGRMAAYTGQSVTWDQALDSEERLGPSEYDWSSLEVAPVALPGRTPLV